MSTLVIRNRLTELARINAAVEQVARDGGLSAAEEQGLELVLEEIVANVIHYGYDDEEEHEISVTIDLSNDRVILQIEDDGRPFDPTAAPAPDTEVPVAERPIGGLGIHLVRNFVDGMTYERRGDRNVLTLSKRMKPREG